ncbi:hypothetical protein EA462_11270 [Natrarchaeobius halalkaliphilus]|uniref:Transposase n=1 Tax=Natrarchaeobius halalkaliphilus TaxID=1679091 RepID=A0A3N6MU93_9EURY|nr:hypothetical protein EA462_11270 [Natrarchaeobius halalkaliphilus]
MATVSVGSAQYSSRACENCGRTFNDKTGTIFALVRRWLSPHRDISKDKLTAYLIRSTVSRYRSDREPFCGRSGKKSQQTV